MIGPSAPQASSDKPSVPKAVGSVLWISILTLASVAFSLSFACATPLAAIGALAATKMRGRPGLALIAAAWFVNQLVGYCIVSYPRTSDSFAWGAAIGIAALLATISARQVAMMSRHPIISTLLAFVSAFAVYEVALFAATAVLPSGADAFSLSVVAHIFVVNAVAFIGLLLVQRGAVWLGLQQRVPALRPALGN